MVRGPELSPAVFCCLPELQLIDTFPVTCACMRVCVCVGGWGGEDGGVATAALRFDTVEQAGKWLNPEHREQNSVEVLSISGKTERPASGSLQGTPRMFDLHNRLICSCARKCTDDSWAVRD